MPLVLTSHFYSFFTDSWWCLSDMCLYFLSMVLYLSVRCFLEGPKSPLKPTYTNRKSKSEFFHSSLPFPHQNCLQGEGIQIPLYPLKKRWKDVMGHARESLSGGHGTEVSSPVPCRYTCDWACRRCLLLCLLQGDIYRQGPGKMVVLRLHLPTHSSLF